MSSSRDDRSVSYLQGLRSKVGSGRKIPFLKGRPERILVINDDDIANLKIALNTSASLEEFILTV